VDEINTVAKRKNRNKKERAKNSELLIKLFNDARSSEVNTYIKKYMKNEENM